MNAPKYLYEVKCENYYHTFSNCSVMVYATNEINAIEKAKLLIKRDNYYVNGVTEILK